MSLSFLVCLVLESKQHNGLHYSVGRFAGSTQWWVEKFLGDSYPPDNVTLLKGTSKPSHLWVGVTLWHHSGGTCLKLWSEWEKHIHHNFTAPHFFSSSAPNYLKRCCIGLWISLWIMLTWRPCVSATAESNCNAREVWMTTIAFVGTRHFTVMSKDDCLHTTLINMPCWMREYDRRNTMAELCITQ